MAIEKAESPTLDALIEQNKTSRLPLVSGPTEHRGSSCRERVNFCLSSDLDKMRILRHIGACMYDAISDQKMQGKMRNRLHHVSSRTEHRGSMHREGSTSACLPIGTRCGFPIILERASLTRFLTTRCREKWQIVCHWFQTQRSIEGQAGRRVRGKLCFTFLQMTLELMWL